jgi:hypothetical protein
MGTSSLAISQSLYKKLSYDLLKDFAPITQAVNYANLLVVHPSAGVSNVAELLALARAKPGALSYGTAGNGTPPHMTGELFKSYTKVNILHIPYKGGRAGDRRPDRRADSDDVRQRAAAPAARALGPHQGARGDQPRADPGAARGALAA